MMGERTSKNHRRVHPSRWFAIWALALLLVPLALPTGVAAREVVFEEGAATLFYGEHQHGTAFRDTLTVRTARGDTLAVLEAESTCECVQVMPLPSGELAFLFDVLPEEPTGPAEKVVYLFTESPEHSLLRLLLTVEVLPLNGGIETEEGAEPDAEPLRPAPPGAAEPAALTVAFFYSPGCQSCRRVIDYTLPHLEERWGERINVLPIDIDEEAGFGRLLAVRDSLGADPASAGSPFLFAVGERTLGGKEALATRLDAAIESALRAGSSTYTARELAAGETRGEVRSLFRSLSFWTIVGAGLLDGINPCAFATLVFFIGLLGYVGSSRRQILLVGTGFTLSVFTVYLLLGLGAFRMLEALAVYGVLSNLIYGATLLLLAVLIALTLRDILRYLRTGETRDQVLQLSRANKRRIHNVMKRGLKARNLFLGALGIGALVTLFEAACTGQVYLPAIVLMLNDPDLRPNAAAYLVLYNLLFVLPLIVVFALAYVGTASGALARWSKDHYLATRVLLGLLFAALAAAMLLQWS